MIPPGLGSVLSSGESPPWLLVIDVGNSMIGKLSMVRAALGSLAPSLFGRGFRPCVCAAGDYRCHLLQVGGFDATPRALSRSLRSIHPCGLDKSFELALYYASTHCEVPVRRKGAVVLFGTDVCRDAVSAVHIRDWLGDDVRKHPYTRDVLESLKGRFHVFMNYFVRNVYDTEASWWREALGPANVFEIRGRADLDRALRIQASRASGRVPSRREGVVS